MAHGASSAARARGPAHQPPVYARRSMSMSQLRPVRALGVLVLTVVLLAGACSRKSAPEADQAAETTIASPASGSTEVPPASTETTTGPDQTAEGSTTTTSSEPVEEAFGYTAEQLAAFRAAYATAFRAECQRIWASMGGGALADPDFPEDQYTVNDCLAELDDTWGELNDSVEQAATAGTDDAQIAASDLADPLCSVGNPSRCWSYGD